MVLVALAGPGMNFLLAIVGALILLAATVYLSGGAQSGIRSVHRRQRAQLHPDQHLPRGLQPAPGAAVRRRARRRGPASAAAGAQLPARSAAIRCWCCVPAAGPSADLAQRRRRRPLRLAAGRADRDEPCWGSSASASDDAPRLDHPRQAGRPRLDPGGQRGQARRCARPASPRPRSAMAARSTRWPAACCRSRSAKRPSSPAACSTRPRPMTSPSASARRPTRSMPKGEVVATSDVRPTLEQIEAVLPRFTGEIEQVPPAYSALKIDGKARLRPRARRRERRAEAAHGHDPRSRRLRDCVRTLTHAEPRMRGGCSHPLRHRLQGHLHPLPRPRHRPCARTRSAMSPC